METPFDRLGGEDGLRRLVDRFYEAMDTLPAARAIRAMHPADLGESRRKLWMFLVGRLGGPPLYEAERGHPRLRARHLPFAVDSAAAEAWMACMDVALDELVADVQLRTELRAFLAQVADHMRNTADPQVDVRS